MCKQFIVVDLEATCEKDDRNYGNEIIEIGAVKVDESGEFVSEFDCFVKPVVKPILTDYCRELTSIQQADIDAAEEFPAVLQKFNEWISDTKTILCSWGYYDKNQFIRDCMLHKIPADFHWLTQHISLKHQFAAITERRQCGMKKALRILNIPLTGTHHRGIDDARNTAKILVHESLFNKWKVIGIDGTKKLEMDALNRVVANIRREIRECPTSDLENVLQYAESLRDYNRKGKKRTFQAGVSQEWKAFIRELEDGLRNQQFSTVKRFTIGENGVNGDGSVYDRYTIYLTSGEVVFLDVDYSRL